MKGKTIGHVLGIVILAAGIASHGTHARQQVQEKNSNPDRADIQPVRVIADPYPTFNGIAVDPSNNIVAMTDPNRKSLLSYDSRQGSNHGAANIPIHQVSGPNTFLGMIAGMALDGQHHEIYAANNDIEDTVVVMPYEAMGNAEPARVFSVPHQSWGLALGHKSDEIAVTVEVQNTIVFYRREVKGVEAPTRLIRGVNTGLADPHGIYWDETHNEIGVANHGNFRGVVKNTGAGCYPSLDADIPAEAGVFRPPSVTLYSASAKGDGKPLRTLQGAQTGLDWPMGMAYDPVHDTIVVANNGDSSIRIFDRNANGNVAPVRVIHGDKTSINHPMGVAVDPQQSEIWVSNWGDHSALAFDSGASGNTIPKREIRSAPAGTPTPGFGNPMALAYDSKRDEILVPNCVTQPRVAAFARLANGQAAPKREITGQGSKLGRTVHGLAYDGVHDEIVVPNALADAVLVFRGSAEGPEHPIRVIQGPHTHLVTPHSVSLDLAHGEMYVASLTGKRVNVFAWNANGDATPLRVIEGPSTNLGHTVGIAVDTATNLVAVANSRDILIFNRTDCGNVVPRGRIMGPKTGIGDEPWQMELYDGEIFVAASNHLHQNLYTDVTLKSDAKQVPEDPWLNPNLGFVGVWKITDNGDVPPLAKIKGPFSGLLHPVGLALNPKDGEIYVSDSVRNGVFSFLLPQFFREGGSRSDRLPPE
jgi:DNA-binding beta-propeller fold protein YncE